MGQSFFTAKTGLIRQVEEILELRGGFGELTLSATLTQTRTRTFGELGFKFYTAGTQHS